MSQNITTEDVEFKPVLRIPKPYLAHLHEVIITCTVIITSTHVRIMLCVYVCMLHVCLHASTLFMCICVCVYICVAHLFISSCYLPTR